MTFFRAFWIFLKNLVRHSLFSLKHQNGVFFIEQWTEKQLERLFIFSVMWSLGAILELDDRAKLEEYALTHPSKLDWPKCQENETVFEYVVNPESGKWEHWRERVEEFIYPKDSVLEFTNILVPNVDNVRTAFLINNTAKQNKAVLLIGEPGTAKTVMIKGYLSTFDPDYKLSKSFNFSSATTPNMVQVMFELHIVTSGDNFLIENYRILRG